MSGGDLPGVSGCPRRGYLGVLRVGIWVFSEYKDSSGCLQRGYLGVLRGGIWVSSGEEQGDLGDFRGGIWVTSEGYLGVKVFLHGCLGVLQGYRGVPTGYS